jgi:hypothetical protein
MTTSFKDLIGKKMSKDVKFMDSSVTIRKLSVTEVLNIQEAAKAAGEDETANFDLLKMVIKSATVGAEELSEADFDEFPLDDLSRLSEDIMKFSGIKAKEGNAKTG